MTSPIDTVVLRNDLSVSEKTALINQSLVGLPDHGFRTALETLRTASDARVASFASNHVALFGDKNAEKQEVFMRILEGPPEIAGVLANLVRFLDPVGVGRVIAAYLRQPSGPLFNLAYEVATWFPGKLRNHFTEVTDPMLRLGMLSGGPENWIEAVRSQYLASSSEIHLQTLGRFHSPAAAASLQNLRPRIPADQMPVWETAMNGNGQDDRQSRSLIYLPAQSGFVVDANQSPHLIGGRDTGSVPQCTSCGQAGVRVLRLAAKELSFQLRTNTDPEFFGFTCDCPHPPYANVQIDGQDRKTLIGPSVKAGENTLLPLPASLLLLPHPNPTGISLDASSTLSRHQVGGYPQWIRPEPFPVCLRCQQKMRFMAQIDSGMTPLGPLKLRGILYCFWCEDCTTSTTLVQED